MQKNYKYILLDWDGNIAKTLDLWLAAQDEVLSARGVKFNRQELIESCRGFVAFVTKNSSISGSEATDALEEVVEIVNKNLPEVELYPGAAETLKTLKNSGKHLALITTSRRCLIEPVLNKFDLSNLFEAVICDEDIPFERRKPQADSLYLALQKMGGTPAEAIMVGDRDKDILAGKNAGMDSVLFYSGEHQQFYKLEELTKHEPTFVMQEFEELVGIVGGSYK